MTFDLEVKIRRLIETRCCRRVYYTWMKESVEADSEQEAIDKISMRSDVVTARII